MFAIAPHIRCCTGLSTCADECGACGAEHPGLQTRVKTLRASEHASCAAGQRRCVCFHHFVTSCLSVSTPAAAFAPLLPRLPAKQKEA